MNASAYIVIIFLTFSRGDDVFKARRLEAAKDPRLFFEALQAFGITSAHTQRPHKSTRADSTSCVRSAFGLGVTSAPL